MQFYNLDKKSESARGRKSLDPKHDQLPTIGGGGGGLGGGGLGGAGHKQDKISVLLQAAASQQRFNLSHYMSVLSPYLRPPLVAPSVALAAAAAGGLLMGGPRFFALGGGGGGVVGALPAIGSAMLPPGVLGGGQGLNGGVAVGQPLKEVVDAAVAAVAAAGMTPPPVSLAPPPSSLTGGYTAVGEATGDDGGAAPDECTTLPEDLSTKRGGGGGATDLSRRGVTRYDASTMTDGGCGGGGGQAVAPHAACRHGRELKELRRNILRMLSVFTPELNIESGIDCDSDQVDQLLHDVVYSNDDSDDDGGDDVASAGGAAVARRPVDGNVTPAAE